MALSKNNILAHSIGELNTTQRGWGVDGIISQYCVLACFYWPESAPIEKCLAD